MPGFNVIHEDYGKTGVRGRLHVGEVESVWSLQQCSFLPACLFQSEMKEILQMSNDIFAMFNNCVLQTLFSVVVMKSWSWSSTVMRYKQEDQNAIEIPWIEESWHKNVSAVPAFSTNNNPNPSILF